MFCKGEIPVWKNCNCNFCSEYCRSENSKLNIKALFATDENFRKKRLASIAKYMRKRYSTDADFRKECFARTRDWLKKHPERAREINRKAYEKNKGRHIYYYRLRYKIERIQKSNMARAEKEELIETLKRIYQRKFFGDKNDKRSIKCPTCGWTWRRVEYIEKCRKLRKRRKDKRLGSKLKLIWKLKN
jgi:hypothetical protein